MVDLQQSRYFSKPRLGVSIGQRTEQPLPHRCSLFVEHRLLGIEPGNMAAREKKSDFIHVQRASNLEAKTTTTKSQAKHPLNLR